MTETVPTQANCALCKKSRKVRLDPTALTAQLVCMALPPQVVAIPAGNQIQMQSIFPAVSESMSCYLFEPLEQVAANH